MRWALIPAGPEPWQVTFEPLSSTGSKVMQGPQTMNTSLKVSLRFLES
jgi:hypothetical protein